MPTSKETRVRSDGFSKMTATDSGPASGRYRNRSAFMVTARSRTSAWSTGLRSSSRRKCRVIWCSRWAQSWQIRLCLARVRLHRVAAERAAVAARSGQGGRVAERDAGAERQAAAEPLGERDHIWLDAFRLVGEPVPGAADAGLYLVQRQQRAVL